MSCGLMLVREKDGLADLLRLGVDPFHQQKGLGSRLLDICLAEYRDVVLHVRKNNEVGIALYRSRGFKVVGATSKSWVMRLTSSAK